MNKREFLRVLGAAGLTLAFPPYRMVAGSSSSRKNWVWITTDFERSDNEWTSTFAMIRKAGISAILPEIYNGRNAFYKSRHLPVKDEWLERILPLAHAAGLEVHAWMWSMPCNIESIVREHQDWYVVNRKGESAAVKPAYVPYYKFLCPSHSGVRDFIKATVTELSALNALDGVHFDYIRFPDVILARGLQPKYGIVQDREYPEYDYCYCEVCKRDFRKEYGIDVSSLDDPTASKEWRQFRYDRITRLVNNDLIPIVHRHGKKATAAVFPNWQMVRQQWSQWNLDAALPMLYHGFYKKEISWIGESVREELKALHKPIPIYAGLFVPQLDPQNLAEAIDTATGSGAAGVSLFALQSMTPGHWNQLSRTLQR